MKYRKRPVVIEAIQYEDNQKSLEDCEKFCDKIIIEDSRLKIETLEGTSYNLSKGDYIIKGVEGEFYPCRPDIFEKTYIKED